MLAGAQAAAPRAGAHALHQGVLGLIPGPALINLLSTARSNPQTLCQEALQALLGVAPTQKLNWMPPSAVWTQRGECSPVCPPALGIK